MEASTEEREKSGCARQRAPLCRNAARQGFDDDCNCCAQKLHHRVGRGVVLAVVVVGEGRAGDGVARGDEDEVRVILAGLVPIVWSSGTGSEVMSRIAAPMLGGMVTAPLLSLFVIPAVYVLMRKPR